MPSYEEDYKAIETARQNAGGLLSSAASLGAGANTFGDEVMANVRNARAERGISGLGKDYANVTKELATYGPDVRARTADVNPMQVDAITARERGDVLGRMSSISTMMTEQSNKIEDIIGTGTNRLKAAAILKQAEADKAKEDAAVMMKMVQIKQEEDQRQFERIMKQRELALEAQKANATTTTTKYDTVNGFDAAGNPIVIVWDPKTGKEVNRIGGAKNSAPTGAQIAAYEKQGYTYNPVTKKYEYHNPMGIIGDFWDMLTGSKGKAPINADTLPEMGSTLNTAADPLGIR